MHLGMRMAFPAAPSGFSLFEMRRGASDSLPGDGTQAKRRRKDAFRAALATWVEEGGRCDLLALDSLENSPVSHFSPALKAQALAVEPTVEVSSRSVTPFGSLGKPKFEAVQVPVNLPDVKHHPVILVTGLQAWFAGLSREYNRIFLRYLFEFDPDQQTPAPGLFTQALSNARLAACYDMAPWSDREQFVRCVVWRGVQDEPRTPSVTTMTCYEVAVVPGARAAMIAELGSNPWAPAIAAYLLTHSGSWSPNGVELSICQMPLKATHLQAHLEESPTGMAIRELVPLLTGFMRVGAATGDKLAMVSEGLEAKTVRVPTLFDEKPRAKSMVLTYGVFAKVPASSGIAWSPLKTPAFVLMLGVYESVRLISATFSLSVPAGAGNTGYAAITSAGTALKGDDWFAASFLKMVPGSDQGSVVASYELPTVHSFNPELRANLPGNGPPEFKFSLAGDAGGKMIVTGQFRVEVAGQVVLGSVDVSGAAKLARAVRTVQASLAYPVVDCEVTPPDVEVEDSDEESDDDSTPAPVPVVRASPPRNRE